jgi:hypothetical protein
MDTLNSSSRSLPAFQLMESSEHDSVSTNYRRELKFALPLADLQKLRSILEVNFRRKIFNQIQTRVSSIYFDDHALSACRESIDGVGKRGKLRLRWYDDHDSWFFFEIKRRLGSVMEKRRLAVASTVPLRSMGFRDVGRELPRVLPPDDQEIFRARPEPVLMTIYKREHFYSRDTSIRVTLDYDVRCYDQSRARKIRERFGVPIPDLIVVEGKVPVGDELDMPRLLYPLRPVLTKSSKYVMGCRVLGLLPGYRRDPYA